MFAKRIWGLATLLLLLSGGMAMVEAQELAGSFDQLQVLVKPGDTVSVTDDAGRQWRGRIADLSPASLVLLVAGQRHDLAASEINTIRQRRPDSLANGAKWGFAVGSGLGLLGGLAVAAAYEDDSSAAGPIMAIALIYGGIGAGIGTGIDAMMSGNQVIYARRATASARFTVAPVLTRTRKGVSVSLGF